MVRRRALLAVLPDWRARLLPGRRKLFVVEGARVETFTRQRSRGGVVLPSSRGDRQPDRVYKVGGADECGQDRIAHFLEH